MPDRKGLQMIRQGESFLYLILIGTAALLVMTLGCQSTPPPVGPCRPWVESIPTHDTYYYARGFSGPMPKDSEMEEQAKKRARAELGRMIVSHVTSGIDISNSTKGQYTSEIVIILSDAKLNLTEVTNEWHDRAGSCGSPNHYYVLVRIKKTTAEAILQGIK